MTAFFEKLSNVEMFYLGCVIIGGGLFILRSIMLLVGLGGDEQHDVGGHDADCGHDVGGAGHADSDGSPVHDFRMVSLHSLTAFVLMFGLTGFLMTRGSEAAPRPLRTGVAAFATGFATMLIIAKIFQTSRKLQSDGTVYPRDAMGAEGSVYLAIRPGEVGKVQLTVRGAMKIYDARANDPAASLKNGDPVRVVATGEVMVVEKG